MPDARNEQENPSSKNPPEIQKLLHLTATTTTNKRLYRYMASHIRLHMQAYQLR